MRTNHTVICLLGCITLVTATLGVAVAADDLAGLRPVRRDNPPPVAPEGTVDAGALALAFGVPPEMLVSASYTGPSQAVAELLALGVIGPIEGNSFVYMSTGVVGTTPEPGSDFPPEGEAGDAARLTLELAVPPGEYILSFQYRFLSAEAPEFIGSEYDDIFVTRITQQWGIGTLLTTVNSAEFMFVSADNAGGTGFNLYTPDPEGSDTEFGGGGLPDAGLTDWVVAIEDVSSTGTVTVELEIRDRGDGYLDSAIVLDAFALVPLEAVDFIDDFVAPNGQLITDPQVLHQGGDARVGVVADGEARLLLRMRVPSAGTVQFDVDDGSENGFVYALGGSPSPPATAVVVDAVSTPSGWMGFAVYRAPEAFDRDFFDESESDRRIRISALFDPVSSPFVQEVDMDLTVVRPPVVLVHGIWSSASTWTLSLASNPLFDVYRADYRATNALSYAANATVPGRDIADILRWYRGRRLAIAQVDVVAHSMGGILTRRHIAANGYRNAANYQAGDVNRLITLDTPHTGSPMANLLYSLLHHPVIGEDVRSFFEHLGKPIDQGAVEDLMDGSPALWQIPQTTVRAHALVGNGGYQIPDPPGWIDALTANTLTFFTAVDPFHGEENDVVVDRQSQEGGMTPQHYTVYGGIDGIHTFNTQSDIYSTRVVELLHKPVDDPVFGQFPAPSTVAASTEPPGPGAFAATSGGPLLNVTGTFANGLSITSPAAGTVITPGGSVTVNVSDTFNRVDRVLLVGPGVAVIDPDPPFTFYLEIPATATGAFPIRAFGVDGTEYTRSAPVTLQVGSVPSITGIKILPRRPRLRGPGEFVQLDVISSHPDGLERNVSAGVLGTTYASSPTGVVTIGANGLVSGLNQGTSTIVVVNGVHQDSVTVTVGDGTGYCGDGATDVGEECDDGPANSNTVPGACRENCVSGACGDGVVDPPEQCDLGSGNSGTLPDTCRLDCMLPGCGDGALDSGEQCDDGNNTAGDGCGGDCLVESVFCGNGVREADEECDGSDFGSYDRSCGYGFVGNLRCTPACLQDRSCCLDRFDRDAYSIPPHTIWVPTFGDPVGGLFDAPDVGFDHLDRAIDETDDDQPWLLGDFETFATGEFYRDPDDPDGEIVSGQRFDWNGGVATGVIQVTFSVEQDAPYAGLAEVYYRIGTDPWTTLAVKTTEQIASYSTDRLENQALGQLAVFVFGRAGQGGPPAVREGRVRLRDIRFVVEPACPCATWTECQDGLFCNGSERCEWAGGFSDYYCTPGTPPTCDDGNDCTLEACNPYINYCEWTSVDCDDGLFCNGTEVCNGQGGCSREGPFCSGSLVCDEQADTCVAPPPCPLETTCNGPDPVDCEEGGCTATGPVTVEELGQRACLLPDGGILDCGFGGSVRVRTTQCEPCDCCAGGPVCPCPPSCGEATIVDCTTSPGAVDPAVLAQLSVDRTPTGTVLRWTGLNVARDVIAGDLAILRTTGGNFALSTAECLADQSLVETVEQPNLPLERSMFYLMCPSTGPYATFDLDAVSQIGSRTGEIVASPYACE